jgi:hypothetical protein
MEKVQYCVVLIHSRRSQKRHSRKKRLMCNLLYETKIRVGATQIQFVLEVCNSLSV